MPNHESKRAHHSGEVQMINQPCSRCVTRMVLQGGLSKSEAIRRHLIVPSDRHELSDCIRILARAISELGG